MASEKIKVLSDADFQQVISKATMPILVDFWAEWCMPCRRIGPFVEELAAEFEGKAIVAKMNVDENPATPGQFGIHSIPTLLVFKGGKVVDSIVGLRSKDELKQVLGQYV